MLYAIVLGYLALLGVASALRWRYRTWFAMLLLALVAMGLEWAYVHSPYALSRAPAYATDLAARLRAGRWPEQPAELARLIASFRALGVPDDVGRLQVLYRLQVAHGLAGEPVEKFGSVSEALSWNPPAPEPGTQTSPRLEQQDIERRIVKESLEIRAPRLSGWPPELARDTPLEEGAREVAPGVWLAPRPTNPHVGTARFALSARNRGGAAVAAASLTVLVHSRDASGAPGGNRPLLECHTNLRDVGPGETRLFACALPVSLGTDQRPLNRVLDMIEALRAGGVDARVRIGGSLDSSLFAVPKAAPVNATELDHLEELKQRDKEARARRDALSPALARWLVLGAIFAAGMSLPGWRRACLSLPVTAAFATSGVLAAASAGWWISALRPGARGWELIVAVFAAVQYGAPFIGGLLFGNLVYWRRRAA